MQQCQRESTGGNTIAMLLPSIIAGYVGLVFPPSYDDNVNSSFIVTMLRASRSHVAATRRLAARPKEAHLVVVLWNYSK